MGQTKGREKDRGRERKGTEEVRRDWIKEDTEEDYGKGTDEGRGDATEEGGDRHKRRWEKIRRKGRRKDRMREKWPKERKRERTEEGREYWDRKKCEKWGRGGRGEGTTKGK